MIELSVTEVRNALRCPRVFALGRKYSKRVVFPVGASALGSSFHRIAGQFTTNLARAKVRFGGLSTSAPADELADRISAALLAHLVDELERNETYASMPAEVDDLAEALRAFAAYLAQRVATTPGQLGQALERFLHGAEVPVRRELPTPAGAVRLSGRIDAIHAPDEHSYEIVEYKLTDETTEELDRVQVALYRRMLESDHEAVPVILRFGPGLVTTRLDARSADALVDREVAPVLAGMIAWAERPESAPATARKDLCPACPLRSECIASYCDTLAPRDDPPGAAHRPRPTPAGDVELPPAAPRVAVATAPADEEADREGKELADLVVQLYAEQGVSAAARKAPRVGARLVRVEITTRRGSISRLDRAHPDVLHHLEADHGIAASYVREGALRAILAPRAKPRTVRLRPLLERRRPWLSERAGRFVLGETVDGELVCADLSEPAACHLLIGGTTGSGKSVLLKCIAAGLTQYQPPLHVQLTLVDPKRVTFGGVEAALGAHLAQPVCFEARDALAILNDLVTEMEERYRQFSAERLENIDEYNLTVGAHRALPRQVVIIDEFQDLLAGKDTKEEFLCSVGRLGSKARAAGIHLVLATQHPDRKTVPAAIKANMTGKIALKVHQATDSLVVLGVRGAERLLGNGDMLVDLGQGIVRVQGALP